jgi:hypothetical protein
MVSEDDRELLDWTALASSLVRLGASIEDWRKTVCRPVRPPVPTRGGPAPGDGPTAPAPLGAQAGLPPVTRGGFSQPGPPTL